MNKLDKFRKKITLSSLKEDKKISHILTWLKKRNLKIK